MNSIRETEKGMKMPGKWWNRWSWHGRCRREWDQGWRWRSIRLRRFWTSDWPWTWSNKGRASRSTAEARPSGPKLGRKPSRSRSRSRKRRKAERPKEDEQKKKKTPLESLLWDLSPERLCDILLFSCGGVWTWISMTCPLQNFTAEHRTGRTWDLIIIILLLYRVGKRKKNL